jgi:predicted secreted protein
MKKPTIAVCFMSLQLFGNSVWAAEDTKVYDLVNLSSKATSQAANDTVTSIMYAQRQGNNLPALADEVNKLIAQAVGQAKQQTGVDVQVFGYQTTPVYQDQRLTGWRVRQMIRLQSRDAAQLSQLLGDLQSTLALESMHFNVSEEKRTQVEEKLIGEAIASFQRRANLIAEHLGLTGYRLVKMDINTNGMFPVRPLRSEVAAMAMQTQVRPPDIEPGTQTLHVTINGTIELQAQ